MDGKATEDRNLLQTVVDRKMIGKHRNLLQTVVYRKVIGKNRTDLARKMIGKASWSETMMIGKHSMTDR